MISTEINKTYIRNEFHQKLTGSEIASEIDAILRWVSNCSSQGLLSLIASLRTTKNYNDQTCSYRWHAFLQSWGPNWEHPWNPSNTTDHYRIEEFKGGPQLGPQYETFSYWGKYDIFDRTAEVTFPSRHCPRRIDFDNALHKKTNIGCLRDWSLSA